MSLSVYIVKDVFQVRSGSRVPGTHEWPGQDEKRKNKRSRSCYCSACLAIPSFSSSRLLCPSLLLLLAHPLLHRGESRSWFEQERNERVSGSDREEASEQSVAVAVSGYAFFLYFL